MLNFSSSTWKHRHMITFAQRKRLELQIVIIKGDHLLDWSIKSIHQFWYSNHTIRCQFVRRNDDHHGIVKMQQSFCILIWATGFNILRKMQCSRPQVKGSHPYLFTFLLVRNFASSFLLEDYLKTYYLFKKEIFRAPNRKVWNILFISFKIPKSSF